MEIPVNMDEIKIIIDDVRVYHKEQVSLIYHNGNQAMSLLSLYVTLGVASSAGFLASIDTDSFIYQVAGMGLLSVSILLLLGAIFCFLASWGGQIALPGRDPEFWKSYTPKDDDEFSSLFDTYLDQLDTALNENDKINNNRVKNLRNAKILRLIPFGPV